jgi:hypothetical protein
MTLPISVALERFVVSFEKLTDRLGCSHPSMSFEYYRAERSEIRAVCRSCNLNGGVLLSLDVGWFASQILSEKHWATIVRALAHLDTAESLDTMQHLAALFSMQQIDRLRAKASENIDLTNQHPTQPTESR